MIVRDASETEAPKYTIDVGAAADWNEVVEVKGVRTHFYQENAFFKEHLQPTIMPQMSAMGIVKPNRQRIIEDGTLLERAQKAWNCRGGKKLVGRDWFERLLRGRSDYF